MLGASNRVLWRCPAGTLREQYDAFASSVHLDVGPGTGYFLDRCTFPVAHPQITLLDANPDVLAYAAKRLARYGPTTVQADIREPLPLPEGHFESIGMGYVLHCLPGAVSTRRAVLANLATLLRSNGVLFGSTILGRSPAHTRASTVVQRLYNRRGIFANVDDDLGTLRSVLGSVFARHELATHGTVALFAGHVS
ncbi:MAG: class I SAM-dependent methyltransferase [Acidimicrobiales bacterium]